MKKNHGLCIAAACLFFACVTHAQAEKAPEKPAGSPINADKASDFNGDGFVDDDDFALFAIQYNAMMCDDPGMISDCAADLDHNGQVDDADFVIFHNIYQMIPNPGVS